MLIPPVKEKILRKIYRQKNLPKQSMAAGILAGIYISIGALLMSIAKMEGCNKLICGLIFASGLFFVVISGAELFTGNCIIYGLVSNEDDLKGLSTTGLLTSNYISNLLGALLMVIIVTTSNVDCFQTLSEIASSKVEQPIGIIFMRSIACNILVCLAVWFGVYIEPTNSKLEKFIAIIFPVIAFVACGFEHSIANMFILPFGVMTGDITIIQLIYQIFIVSIGNIIGGVFIGILISETMIEG